MSDLAVVGENIDGVAMLTLNRPEKRNALSIAVRDVVSDALDALVADPEVRCVVLTGAGEVFSAGFDLGEFRGRGRLPGRAVGVERPLSPHRAGLPVADVAAVNGPALAGGFDLAVMCDLRIVRASACFAHPEVTFGDVVYGPLHDLVGGAVARELALTGRTVDAAEERAVGLVNRIARRVPSYQRSPRPSPPRSRSRTARRVDAHQGQDRRRRRHRPDPPNPGSSRRHRSMLSRAIAVLLERVLNGTHLEVGMPHDPVVTVTPGRDWRQIDGRFGVIPADELRPIHVEIGVQSLSEAAATFAHHSDEPFPRAVVAAWGRPYTDVQESLATRGRRARAGGRAHRRVALNGGPAGGLGGNCCVSRPIAARSATVRRGRRGQPAAAHGPNVRMRAPRLARGSLELRGRSRARGRRSGIER